MCGGKLTQLSSSSTSSCEYVSLNNILNRRQPWSAYAVQQTTLTSWSFPIDATLLYLCYRATENWQLPYQQLAMSLQAAWMLSSKFVKLFGHFLRYPEDVFLFPIYIGFGYFHCLIKLYAMLTLSEVRPHLLPDHAFSISDPCRLEMMRLTGLCRQPGEVEKVLTPTTPTE